MSFDQLLPQSEDEFRENGYWERFYRLRGEKPLEWYVGAKQSAEVVAQALGEQDDGLIINLGCGTCRWPVEFEALVPRWRVWSIDTSEEAMRRAARDESARLRFLRDDALELSTVASKSVSLVVDKGLVDALHPRDDERSRISIQQLLNTVRRVLCHESRGFLIFSLLQRHMRSLLERIDFELIDVHPVPDDKAYSNYLPFAILVAFGSARQLRFAQDVVEDWQGLWGRVDDASDRFRRRSRPRLEPRMLVAVELRIGLHGKAAAQPEAIQHLRDQVAQLRLEHILLRWKEPPHLCPLAFGISDVRATALLDADSSTPQQLIDNIATALNACDADSDDTDDDEDKPTKITLPDILATTYGFAPA